MVVESWWRLLTPSEDVRGDGGGEVGDGVEESFDLFPEFGSYGSEGASSLGSQASATRSSRVVVETETPVAWALSSMEKPPK